MRSGIIMFAALFALLLGGCTADRAQGPMPSVQANETPGVGNPAEEVYFNPYNHATASDGKDVHYSVLNGIYKIPGGAKGVEKIADGETIVSIALHHDSVYYIDNASVCRVGKDGGNQMTFDIGHTALGVACLKDTLFIDSSDGFYTADIASDPEELSLKKQPRGRPAPNGVFYSMEHVPDSELGHNLYRISPDIGGKTRILCDVLYAEYIITDRWIFYYDSDGAYKADLYGQNRVKIIDTYDKDIWMVQFYNYDDQWVYMGLNPGGFCRMDQETGELEPLFFDANPGGFDIVDGYLYGYDHGEKARMRLPDGETEIAPFE